MAEGRSDKAIHITASVFDRLIDYEPGSNHEAARSYSQSISELKQAVRRDLDWLLNTRRSIVDIDPDLKELSKSLAVYGLADFIGNSPSNTTEQRAFLKQIEEVIKIFAPQLIDVRITFTPPSEHERTLSFRIEGRIDMEPSPEPVTFDTVLFAGSGEFAVKPAV